MNLSLIVLTANYNLRGVRTAHAGDGPSYTGPDRKLVAARALGDDGNRAVRSAHDSSRGIEGGGGPEIHNEAGIFSRSLPRDRSSHLHAERDVRLGVRNVWRDGSRGAFAFEIDHTRLGAGTATRCCSA
jgi:hypothetical protein